MDHLLNFLFVLSNSAFLIPAAVAFSILGFAFGFCNWGNSARKYRQLQCEVDKLESKYQESLPKLEEEPATTSVTPVLAAVGALSGLGVVGQRFKGEEDNVSYSEEFGVLYNRKPAQVDDLTTLDGVNRKTAAKLNKQGVYTFKQIETLNPRQQEVYKKKFKLSDAAFSKISSISGSGFVAGAICGLGSIGKRFKGEEDQVTYSEKFGVLYNEKPAEVDDLTDLAGIDQRSAEQMNEKGIYTFKQIETLNPRQRKVYESEFKLTNIAQVGSTIEGPDSIELETDREVDFEPIPEVDSEVEPEPDFEPPALAPEFIPPSNLPSHNPEERERSKVEEPVQLVGSGTMPLHSNPRVENAIADMGSLGDLFRGEEGRLALDDDLGLVYEQRPEFVDDLTMLKGINAEQAEQINQSGIYTFKQLEAMDETNRSNFEELFDLDEVKWDRWSLQLGWGGIGSPMGFGKMINDQMPEN